LALAHATAGVMIRYGFADSDRTVAVFHGGNFEIEKYRDEVKRNMARLTRPRSQVVFTRDLSENVCLDGAAILAGYSDAPTP
nr:hypothetical protein [Chloroflexia bacterium]